MTRAANPSAYFESLEKWRAEAQSLRAILLACGLDETLKWGRPVYAAGGKNVVGVAAFKTYFGLWFFEGARLADKDGVWRCRTIFNCTDACPRGIHITQAILEVSSAIAGRRP